MNEETCKVLKRLDRKAEEEALPFLGPLEGKVIEDMIQAYKPK